MTYNHAHGYIRVRFGPWPMVGAAVYLLLGKLRLPRGWMIESGVGPHDPECTPTEGVVHS